MINNKNSGIFVGGDKMKEEKRLKILGALQKGVDIVDDLVFIFTLPYGTTLPRSLHLLEKRGTERENKRYQWQKEEKINKEKAKFSDLIYRLKKDGLVEPKQGKIILTDEGKTYLKNKKEKSKTKYSVVSGKTTNLVIFDIPEVERKKRYWLREVLKNLKYKQLQKSVWIGKNKLPEEFLRDLSKLNLHDCVEIFSVNNKGTLRRKKI